MRPASSSARNSALVSLEQLSMEVRVKTEFQHRYYKINKVLLTYIGQWPYQTVGVRRGIVAVLISITTGHILSEIMAGVKYRNDKGVLLECIVLLIFVTGCLMKITCSIWNSQKMLKLLNHIRTDWQVWAQDREINILHRYADRGRNITIAYTVMAYSNGTLFMIQPVVPKIIDVLLRNSSKPGEFSIPVYYYHLDMQKYYFYLTAYSCVCAFIATLVAVALDAIFIVYVQHGCAIFAALGHKLERVGENHGTTVTGKTAFALAQNDTDFKQLVSCIQRHNDAIEYADLIETTYTWYFLFIVGLNIVIISLMGLQIVKTTNDFYGTIKFITWLVVGLAHLYIASYMSQILADHSINIRYYIHNCKWYCLSIEAQRIFPLMLMRCNVPCELTAGKIAVLSMTTFRAFLNTSVSYFMLLRSL